MKPPAKFLVIKHCLFIINNEDNAVRESLKLIRYVIVKDLFTRAVEIFTKFLPRFIKTGSVVYCGVRVRWRNRTN